MADRSYLAGLIPPPTPNATVGSVADPRLDFGLLGGGYEDRLAFKRDLAGRIDDLLGQAIGPTGIPDRLTSASRLFNPISQGAEAGGATIAAFDDTQSPEVRRQAAIDAVAGTLGAAAPAIAGKFINRGTANALWDTLIGLGNPLDTVTGQALADTARGTASDLQYAGRSALQGDLAGVAEAFTPSREAASLSAASPNIPRNPMLVQHNTTEAGLGVYDKLGGAPMPSIAIARGAQAVDAPAAAAQGLLPAADMPMEALGTAGMAMTGGAAAPKPRGALGANALRNAAEQQRKMTLWHGSPYDFDQFDLAHIGRGEGAQDLGRGFSLTDSQGEAILYTNPASRWGDLAAMERYRQAGPGRYYRVDINAAPEQFLDWNKPWRDQVPEGTPLYDAFAQNEAVRLSQYADDPAMQEAIPRAKVFQMWRDNAGFEDAALQSGFVGNNQRNYSGDTQYTVFDPSLLRIDQKFDADGNIASANRDATTGAIAPAASSGGFDEYLRRVNPQGYRVDANDRPNLMMGDMYGMLPRDARKVGERDGVSFYQAPDGASYATAFNPDVGEMDVVGYAMPRGDMTDLAVVNEMQGRGIGSELQYLMRSQHPYALTGGLTEAGEASLRRTYNRLRDEGIVSANASPLAGILAMPNE